MELTAKVCAVIVTYCPNIIALERLLNLVNPQVEDIIVVDNGSSAVALEFYNGRALEKEHFIALSENHGIAVAQNIGITEACRTGASHVILFDQDSIPAEDMVSKLLKVAEVKTSQGKKVAAVGPRYLDERQVNPPPFIQVKGLRVERQPCLCSNSVADVDYLIASGCLIPVATLNDVGGMREELFIDYVDIEWGLRAKSKGFQSFGACGAFMRHELGDEPIEFFGKLIPVHSPLRHYYHFRNAVWMYRQPWLPLHWKLADGWRLVLKYGFYTLFARPQFSHFRMMTIGLWHGLIGRTGKYPKQAVMSVLKQR